MADDIWDGIFAEMTGESSTKETLSSPVFASMLLWRRDILLDWRLRLLLALRA